MEDEDSRILLKNSRGERQIYVKSYVSVHQELLIMTAELSLWFSSMADWHSGHLLALGARRIDQRSYFHASTKLSSTFP